MNSVSKKLLVFTMVGMMQLGLGTSLVAAAPHGPGGGPQYQQDEQQWTDMQQREGERHDREKMRRHNEDDRAWHDRQQQEDRRHKEEMRRIEDDRFNWAMQRRDNEDERAWHERQQREKDRHDRMARDIAHLMLDIILDN